MTAALRSTLLAQFDLAWMLASYHLDTLTTEECLWRPAGVGLHVHRESDGRWRADWPDREAYDIGPSSIAWITWHLTFAWSMALDHAFGDATLEREQVEWPGSAESVRERFGQLHTRWRAELERASDADLSSTARVRWPFQERSLGDLFAWFTVELVKNASEIGYARFVYGGRAAAR